MVDLWIRARIYSDYIANFFILGHYFISLFKDIYIYTMISVLSARPRVNFGAGCSCSAKSKCLVLVFSRCWSTEHLPSTES